MAGTVKVLGVRLAVEGAEKFDKQLNEARAALKLNAAELKKTQAQCKLSGNAVTNLTAVHEELTKGINVEKDRRETLNQVLEETKKRYGENSIQAQKVMTDIAKSEAYEAELEAQLRETNAQIAEQSNKLKLAGTNIQNFGEKVKGYPDKASKWGKNLTVGVTTPLLAIGTAAGKMYLDYEKSAAKVSTVMDTTVMSAKSMSDAIMAAATEVGYSATDYAEATYQAISASVDTADAVDFVKEATKLAEGGFTDLTTAIDIETTALNAYGLEASEATRVSDVLIQTQNKGKTTVDQLASNMGKVIPTAAAYNVSIENLGTSLAILTAGGISTEQSCTYLKSMLNELAKTGSTVSDTLKKQTGKTFSELMESGYSLGDVLAVLGVDVSGLKTKIKSLTDGGMELDEALSKLTEQGDADATAFANLWSSQEAGTAALALLNAGTEKYNETLTDMNGAAGSTQSAFETMQTDGVKLEKSIQTLKNELTAFGEELTPAVEMATDATSKLASWFGNLSEKGKKTVITIAGVAAAAGPVLTVGGKVVKLGGSVIKGAGKLVTWLGKLKKSSGEVTSGAAAMTGTLGKTTVATGGATAGTTALSGAATTATVSIGAMAAALAAVAAVAAVVAIAVNKTKEQQEEFNGVADAFGEKMNDYNSKLETATGVLSNYNGQLLISSETISKIDNGIESAQQKIIKIGENAAAESRAITDKEYEEISRLIGMIDSYASKKLDAYSTQQDVIAAMAARETNMSSEKATEYTASAKKTYEESLAIAQIAKETAYSTAQANLETAITLAESGKITSAELLEAQQKYNEALDAADSDYNTYVKQVNDKYGETMSAITNAYNAQGFASDQIVGQMENATAVVEESEKIGSGLESLLSMIPGLNAIGGMLGEGADFAMKTVGKDEALKNLKTAFEGAEGEATAGWLNMIATTELYGGELDEETQKKADAVLTAFENLPEDAKTAFKQTMQGALNGLKEKEPELYKKADGIANGVISRLNKAFDIHSPSRVVRKIFRYVGQAMPLGLEDEEGNIYGTVGRITKKTKSALTSLVSTDWSKYANFGSIAAAQARAVEAMRQYSYNSSYHYSNDDNRQYYTTESGIHIGSLVVSGTDGQSLDRQLELIEEKRAAAARARGIR